MLAGGPAILQSPGWTGPPTNRVGSRGARASRESKFLAGARNKASKSDSVWPVKKHLNICMNMRCMNMGVIA